jgi:long-chain fatty acid transport protein
LSDLAVTSNKAAAAAVVVASLAFCSSRDARAQGFSVARFGGEHGTPMTTDATAIYYNPAGIGFSKGGHAYGDLSLAWRSATYDHAPAPTDAPVPPGAEGANAGHASLLNFLASPFLGATYRLGDAAIGIAFYTPFGGQDSWDQNDAFKGNKQFPGAVDGVQRWYSITGEIRSSFLSFAGAYRFGNVSVGASLNVIDSVVNTIRAREATGQNDLATEGRSWLDTTAWNVSAGIGVTVDAIPNKVRVALSYQSRPNFAGGFRTSGTLHTAFASNRSDKTAVDFHTDLPDIFRAGVSWRPMDQVELRLFGSYERWSALGQQCVTAPGSSCHVQANGAAQPGSQVIINQIRDWHDAATVRLGASYWFRPDLEAYVGLGYASTAVPNSTLEPGLPDFHTLSIAVGGSIRVLDRLRLDLTYTEYVAFSRDNTGESIHPTLNGPTGAGSPSRNPDSGGKYGQDIGAFNLSADFAF